MTATRTLAPGEVLFHEGDPSIATYIIQSGCLAITKSEPGNKSVVLAKLTAPQVVGEMGVVEGIPRTASAKALEETVVEVIPSDDFIKLIRRDPEVALRIIRTLSKRLRQADEIISHRAAAPEEVEN